MLLVTPLHLPRPSGTRPRLPSVLQYWSRGEQCLMIFWIRGEYSLFPIRSLGESTQDLDLGRVNFLYLKYWMRWEIKQYGYFFGYFGWFRTDNSAFTTAFSFPLDDGPSAHRFHHHHGRCHKLTFHSRPTMSHATHILFLTIYKYYSGRTTLTSSSLRNRSFLFFWSLTSELSSIRGECRTICFSL